MSALSGYYLVQIGSDGEPVFDSNGDPIPVGSLIPFPVVGRWGRTIRKTRPAVRLKTELSRNWIFPQGETIRTRELIFDCLEADLLDFETLDLAVDGDRDPFLYVEEISASPQTIIFVRKDADWDEGEEEPVSPSGSVERRVRFIMHLIEEPTGTTVTT